MIFLMNFELCIDIKSSGTDLNQSLFQNKITIITEEKQIEE